MYFLLVQLVHHHRGQKIRLLVRWQHLGKVGLSSLGGWLTRLVTRQLQCGMLHGGALEAVGEGDVKRVKAMIVLGRGGGVRGRQSTRVGVGVVYGGRSGPLWNLQCQVPGMNQNFTFWRKSGGGIWTTFVQKLCFVYDVDFYITPLRYCTVFQGFGFRSTKK